MTANINLLPWRQSRRYARLQWWGALLSGSLLVIVGIALGYYALSRVDNRVDLLLADAEKKRAETLIALKPRRNSVNNNGSRRNKEKNGVNRCEAGSLFYKGWPSCCQNRRG